MKPLGAAERPPYTSETEAAEIAALEAEKLQLLARLSQIEWLLDLHAAWPQVILEASEQ